MSSSLPSGAPRLERHPYPKFYPRSRHWTLRAGGECLDVLQTDVGDFATVSFQGAVEFEVGADRPFPNLRLSPVSRGIALGVEGDRARFTLAAPDSVMLQAEGLPPLFLFGTPCDEAAPGPQEPGVRRFRAGQIHEVGLLEMQSGETLYLEGGAVVYGAVLATEARDIRIAGPGVLDGGFFVKGSERRRRTLVLEAVERATVQDVTIVRPSVWTCVVACSRDVRIERLHEIGWGLGSDGIDVVSSQRVAVSGCFLRNGDDNLVVKALDGARPDSRVAWGGDVEDVTFEKCTLFNDMGGSAMEIGYETRADSIRGVRFRDIDVVAVHGHGSVFGIHTGDRAEIQDIVWDDIRVEHCYDKFVDFRILNSRWNRESAKGRVRGVRVANVRWDRAPFNAGYTVSVIGGFDAAHRIEDVMFENVVIDGKRVACADDMDLFARQAENIRFA